MTARVVRYALTAAAAALAIVGVLEPRWTWVSVVLAGLASVGIHLVPTAAQGRGDAIQPP